MGQIILTSACETQTPSAASFTGYSGVYTYQIPTGIMPSSYYITSIIFKPVTLYIPKKVAATINTLVYKVAVPNNNLGETITEEYMIWATGQDRDVILSDTVVWPVKSQYYSNFAPGKTIYIRISSNSTTSIYYGGNLNNSEKGLMQCIINYVGLTEPGKPKITQDISTGYYSVRWEPSVLDGIDNIKYTFGLYNSEDEENNFTTIVNNIQTNSIDGLSPAKDDYYWHDYIIKAESSYNGRTFTLYSDVTSHKFLPPQITWNGDKKEARAELSFLSNPSDSVTIKLQPPNIEYCSADTITYSLRSWNSNAGSGTMENFITSQYTVEEGEDNLIYIKLSKQALEDRLKEYYNESSLSSGDKIIAFYVYWEIKLASPAGVKGNIIQAGNDTRSRPAYFTYTSKIGTIIIRQDNSWVEYLPYYHDGTSWIQCIPYYYDGEKFVEIGL